MSIKKTNESVDSIDIMRISQELILKNRTAYQSKIGKSRKLMRAINEKYGPATLTIINCRYNDVHDPKRSSAHLYKARSGKAIWTRKETEENNRE